jgi:hypothetical protein
MEILFPHDGSDGRSSYDSLPGHLSTNDHEYDNIRDGFWFNVHPINEYDSLSLYSVNYNIPIPCPKS